MGKYNYVENNEISFTPYFQYKTLDQKLILKAKAGYSSADFGIYNENDRTLVGISAFNFGQDRTQFNPETNGGFVFKIEAIYRINTQKE